MYKEPLFIAAGTKGARKINDRYQPFLEIDGQPNIKRIVDEATKSNVGDIYIWGPKKDLDDILFDIIKKERNKRRIIVLEQKYNLVENFLFTLFEYLKNIDENFKEIYKWKSWQGINWEILKEYSNKNNFSNTYVNVLPTDIPLIKPEEIDFLIKNKDLEYDLLQGWSLKDSFEEIINNLKNHNINFDSSQSKMNFFRFIINNQLIEARFNNFYGGKPLRIDPNLYILFQNIIKNRNLVNKTYKDGKEVRSLDIKNFIGQVRGFSRYLSIKVKDIDKVAINMYFLYNAFLHVFGTKEKNPEMYRDIKLIEEHIKKLTKNKMYADFTNLVGPLFDTDTDYEYEFIKTNFSKIRTAIDKYYSANGMQLIHN